MRAIVRIEEPRIEKAIMRTRVVVDTTIILSVQIW